MKTAEIIYKMDNFHSATFPELRVGATYRLNIGDHQEWGDYGGLPFTEEKIAALCKGMPLDPQDREPLAGQMNRILEEALNAPRESYLSRALHSLTGANGAEIGHLMVEVPGLLPPERVGHRELIGSSEVFMGPLRHDAGMFKVDLPDGRTFFGLLTKQGPVWEAVHADLCERGVLPSLAAVVASLVKKAVEKAERTGRLIKTYSKLEVMGACVTVEAPYFQPITNNEKKEKEMNTSSDIISLTPEESQTVHRSIIEPAAKDASSKSETPDSLYNFIDLKFDWLRAIREAEGLTMKQLYKRLPKGKGKSLSFRSFATYYYRIAKARALAEEKESQEAQEALVGGEGNQQSDLTFIQSGFQFTMNLNMVQGDDGASLIHNFEDWIARERKGRKFLDAFIRSRELIIKPWGIESGPFCSSDAVTVAGDTIGDYLTTHGTGEGALPVTLHMRLHDMEGEEIEWVTADEVGPDFDLIESFTYADFCVSKGELIPLRWHEDEKKEEEEWEQARQEPAEPMPVKEQSDDVQRGYVFEMRLEDINFPASFDEEEDAESLATRFQTWIEDDLDYNADLLDAIHEKSILIGNFGIRSGSFCSDFAFETAVNTLARFIYEMGGKKAGLSFEAEVGKYRNGHLLGMRGRPYLFRIENRRVWRPQQDAFCKEADRVPA